MAESCATTSCRVLTQKTITTRDVKFYFLASTLRDIQADKEAIAAKFPSQKAAWVLDSRNIGSCFEVPKSLCSFLDSHYAWSDTRSLPG